MKKQLITLLLCAGALGSIAQTTFTLDLVAEGNFGTPNADIFRRNTTISPATTSGGIYQAENSTGGFDVLQDFVVNGNNAIIAEKPAGVGRVTIVSYPSLAEIHTFTTSNAPQALKFVDATKAYVSMGNPGGLNLIDLSNNTMTPVIDPSNNVYSYANHMESVNGILYAALGSTIVKVDASTNTVVGTIDPTIGAIKGLKYVSQDNKLWVLNGSGSLISIDITNNDAIGTAVATGVSSTKLLRTYNGSLYFWGSGKKMYIYSIASPASLPLVSSYTSSLIGGSWSFGYGRSFDVDTTTGDFVICTANNYTAPGYYEVVDGASFTIIESSSIAGCAIPNRCILKTFDSSLPAPIPDVANLLDITTECSANLTPPTADNGAITATTTDPLTYASQGSFTVNWTYSNGGQTATQTQTVIINDITNPVVVESILDTIWLDCNETLTIFPTATDNCVGTITGTTTDALSYTTSDTTTITWTYTDNNNNSITQNQVIIIDCPPILDPIPDVTNLADVTAECSTTLTPPTADNGAITATTTDPLTYVSQGSFTVNWTYINGSQTVTQTQTVIINDTTNPVAVESTLDTLWMTCHDTITILPTATDNCAGSLVGTTTDPLSYTTPGTNTITWTYTDENSNSISQSQTVIVSCETDGLDELTALNFDVFPNPTHGEITVINTNNITYFGTIRALNGQIVSTLNNNTDSTQTIQLYGLESGIYVLQLQTSDGEVYIKKLIIQ